MSAHAQRMRSLLAADREGVFCRVAKGGREREARGCIRGRDRGARSVQGRRRDCGLAGAGRGARGSAHLKHVARVRDAGDVPAQRLVEGPRALPRVASRAHGAGRAAGRERRTIAACTQRAWERVLMQVGG